MQYGKCHNNDTVNYVAYLTECIQLRMYKRLGKISSYLVSCAVSTYIVANNNGLNVSYGELHA